MPRHNRNAAGRRFDTRMTFKEYCNKLRITPMQRVKMIKFYKEVNK